MARFMLLFVCSVVLLGLAQAAFPDGLFKAPFLPFHLVKNSLTESARKTREAEQQVQEQIQAVVNQVNAAVEKNAELNRRDSFETHDDDPDFKSTLDQVRGVLDSLQANRREVNREDTNNNDDVTGDDVSKRGGQVLGLGGTCASRNQKCSAFTTHCCYPWHCQYKKWYHRVSTTGGLCT